MTNNVIIYQLTEGTRLAYNMFHEFSSVSCDNHLILGLARYVNDSASVFIAILYVVNSNFHTVCIRKKGASYCL